MHEPRTVGQSHGWSDVGGTCTPSVGGLPDRHGDLDVAVSCDRSGRFVDLQTNIECARLVYGGPPGGFILWHEAVLVCGKRPCGDHDGQATQRKS